MPRLLAPTKHILKYVIIVPVWGKEYVDLFTQYSLPSHLASGNVDALEYPTYLICCTSQDEQNIRNSASFKILESQTSQILFIKKEKRFFDNNITMMSRLYKAGINHPFSIDSGLIFLNADLIVPHNTFFKIKTILSRDKRVIYTPCLRTIKENLMPLLEKYKRKKGVIEIDRLSLVKLTLENLHPIMLGGFIEESHGSFVPSNLFWEVKGEGLISHNFHLHPLAVYPEKRTYRFHGTIDDDFVENCCPDFKKVYIPKTSNDLFLAELTKKDRISDSRLKKESDRDLLYWIKRHTTSWHLKLFEHSIKIFSETKIRNNRWREKEKKAENFKTQVLSAIRGHHPLINLTISVKIFLQKQKNLYFILKYIKNILKF